MHKAFRKWNGFGDDVIAEQPSHPHLIVHDAVCHATPCVDLDLRPLFNSPYLPSEITNGMLPTDS